MKNKFFYLFLLVGFACKANTSSENTAEAYNGNSAETHEQTSGDIEDSITLSNVNTINSVTMFIENSGSMFGYATGTYEFTQTVSRLAHHHAFDHVEKNFSFINGSGNTIAITRIGNSADNLRNRLNVNGFRVGNWTSSDLTGIIERTMQVAGSGRISIMISDGIYDVGNYINPTAELEVQANNTERVIRMRLEQENLHAIVVKMSSRFNGRYYFGSRSGGINIDQQRPYYIWIFGEADILKEHFREEYFRNELVGYKNLVHFLINEGNTVPYKVTAQNRVGEFRINHHDDNLLERAKPDNNRNLFQFSVAVDFASLPFGEDYLVTPDNYSLTDGFNVVSIERVNSFIPGLTFRPTHLITISANPMRFGNLTISLLNKEPGWIEASHSTDDFTISGDTETTFGFQILMNAFVRAYNHRNQNRNIVDINLRIRHN